MRVYHDFFWYPDPDQRFLMRIRIRPNDTDPDPKHCFEGSCMPQILIFCWRLFVFGFSIYNALFYFIYWCLFEGCVWGEVHQRQHLPGRGGLRQPPPYPPRLRVQARSGHRPLKGKIFAQIREDAKNKFLVVEPLIPIYIVKPLTR